MRAEPPHILILLAGGLWNDSRVLKIAGSLSEHYRVTVWCYKGGTPREVPYDVVAFPKNTSLQNKLFERSFFWKPFHRNTKKAHRTLVDAELIWANDLNTLYTGAILAKQVNAKLVYDSHEIYIETINQFFPSNTKGLKKLFHRFNCKLMQKVGKKAERKYGDQANHIFTANDSFKEVLTKWYKWKNISSLYNMPAFSSIPVNYSKSIRDGFSDTDVIVLYHGMFGAGRGLELLVNAMRLLPEQFKLVMLGKGFLQNPLEELVQKNNLVDRVIFLPMVPEEELIEYIRGADIGINLLEKVNLSKWLASPNKLFQYIHAGIPVVCSKSPENMKVMKEHSIGTLVENEPQSIAEGIIKIFENRSNFPKQKMEEVAIRYSWKFYRQILMNKIDILLHKETPVDSI